MTPQKFKSTKGRHRVEMFCGRVRRKDTAERRNRSGFPQLPRAGCKICLYRRQRERKSFAGTTRPAAKSCATWKGGLACEATAVDRLTLSIYRQAATQLWVRPKSGRCSKCS